MRGEVIQLIHLWKYIFIYENLFRCSLFAMCDVTYINASKKVEPQSIYKKLVHSPKKIKLLTPIEKNI